MQTKADILFGVEGQSIFFDAPQGRPSSIVSVELFQDVQGDSSPMPDALGTGTVEDATTTLTADVILSETSNPRLLTVEDVTDFAEKRRYQLVSALRWTEWVDLTGVDENNQQLYLQLDLTADWRSGDTLHSTRMVVPVEDAWAANTSYVSDPLCPRPLYRLAWTYVVAGVTYRAATFADLIRYTVPISATALDVDRMSRGWLFRLAGEDRDTQGADTIAEAFQQVKLDLWAHGLTAYAQRNSEVVNDLVCRKAVAIVHEQAFLQGGLNRELAEYSSKLYWDRVESIVDQSRSSQQTTADGAGGQVRARQLWRR